MSREKVNSKHFMVLATGDLGDEIEPVTGVNPLPMSVTGGAAGTLVDRSGTIAVGGTAQQLAPSNAGRNGFLIQNLSAGDLWFSTLATAVASQPSLKLPAGMTYETPLSGFGTGAISIIGATTGQAFAAREW